MEQSAPTMTWTTGSCWLRSVQPSRRTLSDWTSGLRRTSWNSVERSTDYCSWTTVEEQPRHVLEVTQTKAALSCVTMTQEFVPSLLGLCCLQSEQLSVFCLLEQLSHAHCRDNYFKRQSVQFEYRRNRARLS